MTRIAVLCFLLFVSVTSASLLRKSLSRRQLEPEHCNAIEGFDCKCSYYRVTCTTDRDVPAKITIEPNARGKYQSVELVVNGEREYNIYDSTFEPVKQLYKPDADNYEFRLKFEKFTGLNLRSPGVLNRVFPDNVPSNARKHLALEIYNPLVQPYENPALFQNLNADSLELYTLYPFRGTFQQLFQGANIKYLRLSGGDIMSDLSQSFSGNIGRLEVAKQAAELSVANFPVYPVHEMIINAFYVTNFHNENPPNYSNLGELRIFSQERIPANAFQQFPGIHTLSLSTEKDIDSHALDGLNKLEKLIIRDTKISPDLLRSIPNVKEFETNVEKLDENQQCQLIERFANGQTVIQAIPNGGTCTCFTAYLDTASGRVPCNAQNCEQSSCAALKNNYDGSTRTFKLPPPIRRADGSDASRSRDPQAFSAPFQVSRQDQDKLQHGASHQSQYQPSEHGAGSQHQQPHSQQPQQQPQYDDQYQRQPTQDRRYDDQYQQQPQHQQPDGDQHYHPDSGAVTPAGQPKKSRRTRPRDRVTTPAYDQHGQQQPGYSYDQHGQQQPSQTHDQHGQQQPGYSYDQHGQQQPGHSYDQHGQQQPGQSYDQHGQQQPGQSYDQHGQQQPGYSYDQQGQQQPGHSYDQQGQQQPGHSYDQHGQQQPGYSYDQHGQQQPSQSHDQHGQQQPSQSHDQHGQPQPGYPYDQHGQQQPGYPYDQQGQQQPSQTHDQNVQQQPEYPYDQQGQQQPGQTHDQSQPAGQGQWPSGQPYDQSHQGGQEGQWQPGQSLDQTHQDGQQGHVLPIVPPIVPQQPDHGHHPEPGASQGETYPDGDDDDDDEQRPVADTSTHAPDTVRPDDSVDGHEHHGAGETGHEHTGGETGSEKGPDGETDEQQPAAAETTTQPHPAGEADHEDHGEDGTDQEKEASADGSQTTESTSVVGEATAAPPKKGMRWLPIILIAASIIGLILALAIFLFLRKKRGTRGYNPAATSEHAATATRT